MFSAEVVNRVRQETPGLGHSIHLDNCGASLMPQTVVETMKSFLDQEVYLGGYVAQEQHAEALAEVYGSLSILFGGGVADYALTSSAVDAWTKAFYSVPMTEGDNIVTVYNEYCSNYVACLQRARRDGVEIRVARSGDDGRLDLNHLEQLIDENTKLISITHVASSSGQIADVTAIGKIAAGKGVLYLLDACQSVGQLPVNFDSIGCDMATATSRKFLRGPRGIGFLYINEKARGLVEPVVLTNQSAAWIGDNDYRLAEDASMFESWEKSCMNQLGFGAALKYLIGLGVEKATAQTQDMAAELRQKLYATKNIIPTCQPDATAAIITFNKKGWDAAELRNALASKGVTVQMSTIFHTRLDLGPRNINSAVRISPHYYNTSEEFDQFLNSLEDL